MHAKCLPSLRTRVVSWNVMIGGYAQHGHAADVLQVFNQMCQLTGVQANKITYLNILQACASNEMDMERGKKIHAHIRRGGFESNVRVGTVLLKMYAKCGRIKEARPVFDKVSHRDVISWTVMIGAYSESGDVGQAHSLFLQMQQEGLIPDAVIDLSMLNLNQGASTVVALKWVKEVHTHAQRGGHVSDVHMATALLNMYAERGSVENATEVFDNMTNPNVISWNALIGMLARNGCGVESYQLFLRMQQQEGLVVPNVIT